MDSFQEVIKEDIKELISELPCFFCNKDILFKNLGGIKHAIGNILELENPVCNPCWKTKTKKFKVKVFSSLDDILEKSQGDLTDNIKLVATAVDGEKPSGVAVEKLMGGMVEDFQWKPEAKCSHEYKMLGGNRMECHICHKRFTLMED